MDAFSLFLICFVVLLVLCLLYEGAIILNKNIAHKPAVIFGLLYRRFNVPDYASSPYYGKYSLRTNDNIRYCPTIDDSALASLASQLKSVCKNMSGKRKASFLLAFVQQNVKYVSDEKQYGVSDEWVLPVTTMSRGKGDCEDSAFLFSYFASYVGLDVVTVRVSGHMLAGVNVSGVLIGSSITVGSTKYYLVEPTGFIPVVGLTNSSYSTILAASAPVTPTADYIASLKDIE